MYSNRTTELYDICTLGVKISVLWGMYVCMYVCSANLHGARHDGQLFSHRELESGLDMGWACSLTPAEGQSDIELHSFSLKFVRSMDATFVRNLRGAFIQTLAVFSGRKNRKGLLGQRLNLNTPIITVRGFLKFTVSVFRRYCPAKKN